MIGPKDLMAALEGKLTAQFPAEPVYKNLVERNFKRPSNLVELSSIEVADIGLHSMDLRYLYKITDFIEVNDYHNSDTQLLDFRTLMIVGGVFGAGYLTVGGKTVNVEKVTTNHNFDFSVVTAALRVRVNPEEFRPEITLPLMEQLQLKEAVK